MKLDRVIAVRNNKTIYRDGDKCIKVFNDNYLLSDVLNESLNQSRAYEAGINVPKLLEVTTFDGKYAIVSEYVRGKTLEQLMDENPEKKNDYIELMVNAQLNIGAKSSPKLRLLKHKMRDQIRLTDLDSITRYDLHNRINVMTKKDNVCHGDFCPSNIIITENEEVVVIDWAHASLGNTLADVANTYLLFWMHGDISGAEKYIQQYSEKSGIEKQQILSYMPIVAASRLAGCSEQEREFLLSWLK